MANTAALLGNLLNTNADINYYTQQSIFWNAKYEEKWESAFDSAIDNTRDLKLGKITVKSGNTNEMIAGQYADAKVSQYNEELSEELADLDIEYDTMKTMYDTMLESLRAQKDSEKQATSTAAQDTGLLQS